MALANDHMYGYVAKLLIQKQVTWLECAAASLVWSTILANYMEAPYGHLMFETMDGPEARTMARGNLFSFSMPREEIEGRCREADQNWQKNTKTDARQVMALPHDEDALAALVNVHIVGGTKDLIDHPAGATTRCHVALGLIALLRQSGHPGYETEINSVKAVEDRMQRMYRNQYGNAPFAPERVRKAMEESYRPKPTGTSLIVDKNATPSEPIEKMTNLEAGLRPLSLVATRDTGGCPRRTKSTEWF